jgi:hypothetical protein
MTGLLHPRRLAPVAVLLALTVRSAAQVIPTDGAPPGPRTGMIVGQVVDASTGAPLGEAIVRLTMPKYFENPAAPKGRVMADGDGRFFFSDLPAGDYYLQATKDGHAPEAPLRVNPNETLEWTVTFTDKPAGLTGVLQESGGRAATDYYILVFSSDRNHWTPGSRRVRMTRPATDGSYVVKGLPPGEYFLAAPADLETGEWNDPALLEQLVRSSAKVTLREGEMTRRGFRIGGA